MVGEEERLLPVTGLQHKVYFEDTYSSTKCGIRHVQLEDLIGIYGMQSKKEIDANQNIIISENN
ncbi:hypothetical protein Tcan_12400 [Toxocara canis]|uniref:Uncharacterized protein n=1 Tax=Toxocara canis TaxID=6265 RepID=A0A0B2VRR8_TOXCA|nr:hypothetical protein Tcan_12400 [Toxocara canis]